ncbi:MAG: regulatory protein RecX [Pseudomonadales bacterium]
MNFLARREHSYVELQRKLATRFPDQSPLINAELDKLREEGLQSDQRLAEAFVTYRSNKGQGPRKIRSELHAKGVNKDTITAAITSIPVDWPAIAQQVAEKKFAHPFGPDSPASQLAAKDKARVTRFLLQRGFSQDQMAHLY